MPTLPTPGPNDVWGNPLNTWLLSAHNLNGSQAGTLKVFNVKDDAYGALGNGSTNDTPAINAALNAANSAGGGVVYMPPGSYGMAAGITMPGPNIALIGAGKNMTKLVRNSTAFGTVITNDNADGNYFDGFSIDGGLSGFATNANQALRIFDSSNVTVRNVKMTNYFNCAVLCFVTTAGTKSNVIIDSCECDGTTGANNGFLLVSMDESIIRHCRAANLTGSSGPNYGLQLKNNCRYCAIEDSYANNCTGGFAFGNDTSTAPSVSNSRITGGVALNCGNGFIGSYFDHCEVEGLVISQQTGNFEAIRIQGSANNSAFIGTMITGTPSPKGAVRFDDSAHDNFVEVDLLDAACGEAGEFESTSANNLVVVRRYGSNRPTNDKAGTSTGTGNQVWISTKPQDQIRLAFGENMIGENFPRECASGTSALTQGTVYFVRIPVRAGMVINNIQLIVTTGAVSNTLAKVGLYSKTGTQLASSADLTTLYNTVGLKSGALSAAYTVPADDVIFAAFLFTGTTGPTVLRTGAIGNQNALSSGGVIPYGTQASQTDLPNPTATIVTSNGIGFWCGLS